MATIVGYGGGVAIGPVGTPSALLIVSKWELDETAAVEDTTPMVRGGSAKHWTATLKEWAVTIEGKVDSTDTHLLVVGEDDVPVITSGMPVEMKLYCSPTDDADAYHGNGIVKSVKPTCAVDGVVTFSVTVQGQGALIAVRTPTP